ncbi:protein disks lost [Wyeomyia smithii]|uniref:protein disks lost n=1 Tax=Wyeomyia smithii TaxID=174621 RepID=UPI0024681799|nr:protein disks lost [Wyeomyia smithii]
MAEEILEIILAADVKSADEFPKWFITLFESEPRRCPIETFADHFLGLIRTQTEDFTKCAPSICDTPKKANPTSVRKTSITLPADTSKTNKNDNNAPISQSTAEEAQLPASSGQQLKTDTGGIGDDQDTSGSRSLLSSRSISRDLFAGAASAVEDFHTGFRRIDAETKFSISPRRDDLIYTDQNDNDRRSCERNENEKHTPAIIEDTPFSPIPSARISSLGKIEPNANSSSTPIRGQSGKSVLHQLNTSTPIVNSSQRSGRGSRSSAWNQDCTSTPNNQKTTPANGSRHDSRRSHDRSFGSNNSTVSRHTSSPCLGDFITHSSLKSKPRKSATNAGASANNSKDNNNSSKVNSLFAADDFPGLQTSMQSSTPGNEQPLRNKKRVTPITVSKTLTSRLTTCGSSFELDNSISPTISEGKVKRRVTPTTLSKSVSNRHDFTSSSFKSDNNLINLTEDSLELDLSQKDERGLLRNYKDIIKSSFVAVEDQHRDTNKMLQTAVRNTIVTPRKLSEGSGMSAAQPVHIELERVTERALIDRLVDVYTVVIDLNMTPNILSELAYLINLINTEFEPIGAQCEVDRAKPIALAGFILKNLNNCVYFALQALNRQRTLLALLDSITLKVLIENERIACLEQSLSAYLREIYTQKLQLDNNIQKLLDVSSMGGIANSSTGGINVFYQQEADTREHFPSDKEFGAFKKQRDAFCTIYRSWDLKHLNPTWNCLTELRGKIRSLLAIMEHPINMAHLAKLFTAQLVQSCNFDNSASELAMALPNVDPAKLVKLRQRLVAPSQFSTQYLFPGSQAFFRDFIIASETNQIFIEQLKAVLIHELLEMNDSSYEVLNVSGSDNQHDCEYVVRPESTTTMRVLAKFIGYIISRPFNCDSYRNSTVENRQIELRNALLPLFDVKSILLKAIAERKLIITVPWMVQYLAMLDGITLRLSYYKELFDVLYELYLRTTVCESWSERKLLVTPTSKFILRACLGWLFEHPNIPEEYYSYRQERRSLLAIDEGLYNYKKINMLVDKAICEEFETSYPLILTKIDERCQGSWKCEIKPSKQQVTGAVSIVKADFSSPKNNTVSLNPLLESILNAACPFLADFRVSMMPSKLEKTVSRSGRYRHITTKYSGASTLTSASGNSQKSNNDQQRLVEAFLRSQSLSVRRTVEFVIERASSAAIKDFQITYILPSRKRTSDRIASLQADSLSHATKEIYKTCSVALSDINASWDTQIVLILARRIQEAFDALLPCETLDSVKKTCINLTLERCLAKTNEWRQTHMFEIDLFCKDIPFEAARAVKDASAARQTVPNLSVRLDRVHHTLVYDKLQSTIHLAASHPDELSSNELSQFLALTLRYLDEQEATPAMYKTLAYMMLQLALLLVINRCDLIVPDVIQSFTTVWKHRKLSEFCTIPDASVGNNQEDELEKLISGNATDDGDRPIVDEEDIRRIRMKKQLEESNYIFSTLVSNRCIRMMEASHRGTAEQVFACFANFINSLVDCNLISIRRLNEQFVQIFSENWQQQTLEHVSRLMDAVLQGAGTNGPTATTERAPGPGGCSTGRKANNADDSHSQLFLEMLSDLAREIEDF